MSFEHISEPTSGDLDMHSQMYRRKASSFRGVYRCGKKWKSQIQIDGVQYYLGVFPTENRAAEEYRIAAKRLGKSDDAEFTHMFKEYAEGESDSECVQSYMSKTSNGGMAASNQNGGVSRNSGSSSSYNQMAGLDIPLGQNPNIVSQSQSGSRSIQDDRNPEDLKVTSFYLIPTNQLSLISSKVKLGKLGEEILALSKFCEENSTGRTEECSSTNAAKLSALRSQLFNSIQLIRNTNTSSISQLQQTKYKHSDLTDDETMYEV